MAGARAPAPAAGPSMERPAEGTGVQEGAAGAKPAQAGGEPQDVGPIRGDGIAQAAHVRLAVSAMEDLLRGLTRHRDKIHGATRAAMDAAKQVRQHTSRKPQAQG